MQNIYPNPNMYGGYNYPNNNTYHIYGQPMVKTPNNQPLTPDQQTYLMNLGSNAKLDMTIDPDTMLRAACTHKDINTGESTVTISPENKCHCAICDAEWTLFDGSAEDVQAAVDKVKDINQTAKLIYADAPDSLIKQYMQPLGPLLDKMPAVWTHSVKSFGKYEDMNNPIMNRVSMNGGNYFNNYNTMLLTGAYGYQPAMPGYAQMNGQVAGYNQMNGQMPVYNQMPNYNPMGYVPQNGMMGQPQGMMLNGQYMGNPMMPGQNQVDPQMIAAQVNGQQFAQPMMPATQFNGQQFVQPMDANPMMAAPAPGVMPVVNAAPATGNNEVIQQKTYNV